MTGIDGNTLARQTSFDVAGGPVVCLEIGLDILLASDLKATEIQ